MILTPYDWLKGDRLADIQRIMFFECLETPKLLQNK